MAQGMVAVVAAFDHDLIDIGKPRRLRRIGLFDGGRGRVKRLAPGYKLFRRIHLIG